jgi:endonuclease-3 related protein
VAASLAEIHRRLRRHYGSPRWWNGTRFEVCVGAILTQNTAWSNVDKALEALRSRRLLSYRCVRDMPAARLARLIRSSGTYNVKARRLAGFVVFLGREYGGRVAAMSREDPWVLRRKLLGVPGIGRETADSIALYAAGLPLFVVDAYTRRIFSRLGQIDGDEPYDEVQRFFMERLPRDTALYSDYHAQIVRLAQAACRKRPLCGQCPLEGGCPKRGVDAQGS